MRRLRSSAMGLALALAAPACTGPLQAVPAGPGRPELRVVFFGDSLVHRSEAEHAMVTEAGRALQRHFPDRNVVVFEEGHNGDRIADLAVRLGDDVLSHRPQAVVLYWDSDASDVDEASMRPDAVAALRAAYATNLGRVLHVLRSTGVEVLVSGPTLLGEHPRGTNPKDHQLDAYRTLNRQAAAEAGATYVDTRRRFQYRLAITPGAPLTVDGEHLSATGARLAGGAFVAALAHQLRHLHAAEPEPPPAPAAPSAR